MAIFCADGSHWMLFRLEMLPNATLKHFSRLLEMRQLRFRDSLDDYKAPAEFLRRIGKQLTPIITYLLSIL